MELSLDTGYVEKDVLDSLGLKNNLSDWYCYEILNVPGKIQIVFNYYL